MRQNLKSLRAREQNMFEWRQEPWQFRIGLATKIPKNGLKIFPEFLQKCSKNLRFQFQKSDKTPKNLQKSYDI